MDYDYISGSGRFIFFLHGWGGDKNSFGIIKNKIQKYDRNAVFVSFSGFGKTAEPLEPYTLDDYVCELLDTIIYFARGKSVDIVCHSFGARVALLLAYKYPFIVNKIMMVDGAGLKPRRTIRYIVNVYRYKRLKRKVAKNKISANALSNFGSADYKSLSCVMKQTFVNIVNRDLKKEAKKIKTQIMLFWGEKDTETPLNMAKKYKKLLKNSSLIIAKQAGHFSYLDDFDLFFNSFKNFILEVNLN